MALAPIIALVIMGWFTNGTTGAIIKPFPTIEACNAGMALAKANLDKNHEAIGLSHAYLECIQSPTPEADAAPAPAAPEADAPKPGVDTGSDQDAPSGGETQD